MIYSRRLVNLVAWILMKARGVLSHYRAKSILGCFGKGSRCDLSVELKYPQNINLGENVKIGPDCTLGAYALIVIEDDVTLSKGVTLETACLNMSSVGVGGEVQNRHNARPIVVKKGAWLGAKSIVLGGVTVGEYAIVGAGTVVSKDVPDAAIVVSSRNRLIEK